MSGLSPSLILSHVFGARSDVPNNVHFVDENIVLYPAGHCLILHDTETKSQRFIYGSKASVGGRGNLMEVSLSGLSSVTGGAPGQASLARTEITAVAVSPNKEHIAVAERGERASILIYDAKTLKKKKILSTSEAASKEYVSLAFSPDSKYLLSQGGSPNFSLINWAWDQVKPLDSVRTEIRVRFLPSVLLM